MTGVLGHTRAGLGRRLLGVPDTAPPIALTASPRRRTLDGRAGHILMVTSSRARFELLRDLVMQDIERGGSVVVVVDRDNPGDVVGSFAGSAAAAALAEGRVRVCTAPELAGIVAPAHVLAAAISSHGHVPVSVIVELGSGMPQVPGSGGLEDPGVCPCAVSPHPGVATTCLATVDDTPPHVLLAAVDRHDTVVVGGGRPGDAVGRPSVVRDVVPDHRCRLESYVAMLPLVDDPIRLAELEAAMLARLANASGAAMVVPGLNVGLVGEEDGRPLRSSRRRELAVAVADGDSSEGLRLLPLPTREPGTAVLLMDLDGCVGWRDRAAVEALLGVAACCHDKLADSELLDRLASENAELRSNAATVNDEIRLIQAISVSVVDGDLEGALDSMSVYLDRRLALIGPEGVLVAGSLDVARAYRSASRSRRADRRGTVVRLRGPRGAQIADLYLDGAVAHVEDELWKCLIGLLVTGLRRSTVESWARDASEASLVLALVRGDDATRFEHRRWAERLHVNLDDTYRVVVLSPGPDDDVEEAGLDAWIRGVLALRVPVRPRVARTPTGLVCLWPDLGEPPEAWAERCQELLRRLGQGGPGWAAVGSPGCYPAGLESSYEQARRLAELQRCDSVPLAVPRVAVYEEAGLIAGVLGPQAGHHLGPFVQRVLGPLLHDQRCGGELVETLGAHLASGGSLAQTAERLHLHRSSVKYRVKLLREVLGERLDDPDHRFELELAIRLLGTFRSLDASERQRSPSHPDEPAMS